MRYPGGKGKCFQQLINLMPPHSIYIETHLGGGAVIRNKKRAQTDYGVDIDPKVIERWRRVHPGICNLINADAAEFLASFTFDGRELVYADPPYVGSVRRRPKVYRFEYGLAEHERLLDRLKSLPCMVMISGYNSYLYNDKLTGWRKVTFRAKTHVDVRQECVWLNFDPPTSLHDDSHIGRNHQERQAIRRRTVRILSKFRRMNPAERAKTLRVLFNEFPIAQNQE